MEYLMWVNNAMTMTWWTQTDAQTNVQEKMDLRVLKLALVLQNAEICWEYKGKFVMIIAEGIIKAALLTVKEL